MTRAVAALLPPNADPHEYEVRPDDVKALADADVLVRSGGELDAWLDGAIENAGSGADQLVLLDRVQRRGDDPHWWQDPRNGVAAVHAIAAALESADPDGAPTYARNAKAPTRGRSRPGSAAAPSGATWRPEQRQAFCGTAAPGSVGDMPPERVVLFRPRTVLQVAGAAARRRAGAVVVWVSLRVLTWVFVALFLALALDPACASSSERGMRRRGAAAAVIYMGAFAFLALLAALLVPPLVDEADGLADAAPGYVEDITAGRGPLGFLERDYQIVDRVRDATECSGGSLLGGGAAPCSTSAAASSPASSASSRSCS